MPAIAPADAIPAATLVVFRRGRDGGAPELLMLQRAREMRFAGGAAVFPGGRVDAADRLLAARLGFADADEDAAARIAAIRETLEETGLAIGIKGSVSAQQAADARAMLMAEGALEPVLDRLGWTIDPGHLIPFARWCPRWPGAFDTRFYIADLGTGSVDIAVDATENTRLFWMSAHEALRQGDSEELSLMFPTRRNLERLALFPDFAAARAQARVTPVDLISPKVETRDGVDWLTIPDGLGYPVTAQTLSTVRRG